MTFIASVVAKEGVAIIADSLVTTSTHSLDFRTFMEYITKQAETDKKEIKLDPREIVKLFKIKPTHTKDYEDKLYKYDKFTAITTAGSANINGKRIKKLVSEAIKKLKPNGKNTSKDIDEKIEALKVFIGEEVKKYLSKQDSIDTTIFILTFFSPNTGKTSIYKMTVEKAKQNSLKDESFEFVSVSKQPDNHKVVCDGQNRLSERILFGDLNLIIEIIPSVVNKVANDFGIDKERITSDYLLSVVKDDDILNEQRFQDMKIHRLTELSLQQAVDLASLLMRIEIDIQKYTENIPTVGGVIKLAVIDNEGFRFIAGNEIVRHEPF